MRRAESNNSGGFLRSGEEADAALRDRFGAEVADRVSRSRELTRHPQVLSDWEQDVLRAALAPILRDIGATGAIVPQIVPEAHERRDEAVCAWIDEGNGLGCGIWVPLYGESAAHQVCWLAEQFVEWESEKLADVGRPAVWPPCPDHPGAHPLWPEFDGESAVWQCTTSERVVSRIGALPRGTG